MILAAWFSDMEPTNGFSGLVLGDFATEKRIRVFINREVKIQLIRESDEMDDEMSKHRKRRGL